MSQQQMNNNTSSSNIPVSDRYWTLVDKADKKFSKIRDLPYYERNRYDAYFYKEFIRSVVGVSAGKSAEAS
ncbi:hypothetical protein J1N35_045074 [Gossypium stocksii]|uniref:Uncharacterized protein n=1 Tax=Gossypium stocksii TaxID=47602 RepID=A0A9D3ZGK5_9ROSI|nr:hypothetical protein J1N35_045074 [Gossypium stocksii]